MLFAYLGGGSDFGTYLLLLFCTIVILVWIIGSTWTAKLSHESSYSQYSLSEMRPISRRTLFAVSSSSCWVGCCRITMLSSCFRILSTGFLSAWFFCGVSLHGFSLIHDRRGMLAGILGYPVDVFLNFVWGPCYMLWCAAFST